jgi:hypothetical protein
MAQVSLMAPPLNIGPRVQSVEPRSDHVQGFIDAKVFSRSSSVELSHYFLNLAPVKYLHSSGPDVDRLQVTLQHAIFHHQEVPLSPVTFVGWTTVSDVTAFGKLSGLHLP